MYIHTYIHAQQHFLQRLRSLYAVRPLTLFSHTHSITWSLAHRQVHSTARQGNRCIPHQDLFTQAAIERLAREGIEVTAEKWKGCVDQAIRKVEHQIDGNVEYAA